MKLYVSNLNPDITGEDLKDVFRLAGRVLSAHISSAKDKVMRAGFVEMETPEAGLRAIEQFDGGQLDGTIMAVRAVADRHKRPSDPDSRQSFSAV